PRLTYLLPRPIGQLSIGALLINHQAVFPAQHLPFSYFFVCHCALRPFCLSPRFHSRLHYASSKLRLRQSQSRALHARNRETAYRISPAPTAGESRGCPYPRGALQACAPGSPEDTERASPRPNGQPSQTNEPSLSRFVSISDTFQQ